MFQMKLFLLVLSLVAGAHTVFVEEPSSVNVTENGMAMFHCRISSGVQGWVVGGEFVDTLNNPDITTRSEPASDGGPPVHTLSIVGRSAYNGTTVQCLAFSFSGNSNSSLATLQIQGLLAAVPELSVTWLAGSILFSWAAPFSFNLTNTEPDITYCVDVLFNGEAGLVAGGCGLNETQYNFTADVRSPCDTFTAVVTPVNGAGNGSTASVDGHFYEAPMLDEVPTIGYKFVNETQEGQELDVYFKEVKVVSVRVCTCELVFRSSDGIVPHLDTAITIDEATCQNVLKGNGSFILNTTSTSSADNSPAVVLNRIYSLEVVLSNSAGSYMYTTPPNNLSTHAVQKLRMMDSNSVTMLEVEFIENTLAPGCVVIITDNVVENVFVGYLSDGNHTDTLTISGLSNDQNVIAAYDLDTSTTPGRYMATNISVNASSEHVSSSSGVEIEGAVKSEGIVTKPSADRMVCARCSDANATECLLLLHPVGNLTEIETLRVRNDQENCTRVHNAGDYIYSTFGVQGDDIIPLSTNGTIIIVNVIVNVTVNVTETADGTVSIVAIVGGCTVFVVLLIVMITLLILLVVWKTQRYHNCQFGYTSKENLIGLIDRIDSDSSTPTLHRTPTNLPATDLPAPDLPPPDLPPPDLPAPFTGDVPDPTYDSVKPAEKHAAAKGASTGSVYVTTKPNTKFQAPPAQDLSTEYAIVNGCITQEGPQYAFPDAKTSTKAKPADQNIVAYKTVSHTVPCTADTKKPEPASSLTAVGKPVAGPTKEQLYAKLLPVKRWKILAALAAQFKLNDGLIDEIYTNNERDEDCLEEVIRFWYMNSDFHHTWSEVVSALEAIGEHTLAEDICAAHSIAKLPGTPEHSKPVFLPPTSRQSSQLPGRQYSSPLLTAPNICVPDNDAPPPPYEAAVGGTIGGTNGAAVGGTIGAAVEVAVVGAVLGAYKSGVAHDTVLPPNGVALFRGAYKPRASATLSQRLSTSLPGIDEDTYKSAIGAHFSKDGRRDSYTDAEGSAFAFSSEPAVYETRDGTDPNRKTGGAKIAEYPQPSVFNPTVASAEYSDHTDDFQYSQVMVEESKSAFCEKRDFLFDYEQVLHSRSALSKQPAFLQYNRKLQKMAASRGFDLLRETSEPDLVLNLPSQPESDEEEGKMTLHSSPALTLLSRAKEISVKLCGHEDLKMADDMKESAVINHFLDHLDASWRALVTALDGMKETEMVDRLRHYCEPPTGFGPSKEQDGQSDGRKDELLDLHNFNPGHKSFAPSGEFDDHTFTIGCEKVFAWFSKTTFGPFDAHNFTPGFMQVIASAGIVGQL